MAAPFRDYGMDSAQWGYGIEVSTHAVRMMVSGVFDRFPKLKICIGHMGEAVHFWLWRLDYMNKHAQNRGAAPKTKLTPSEYFKRNFVITTSGQESHLALDFSIKALGIDNVLWAIDYPYQPSAPAVAFMDSAPVSRGRAREALPRQRRAGISHQAGVSGRGATSSGPTKKCNGVSTWRSGRGKPRPQTAAASRRTPHEPRKMGARCQGLLPGVAVLHVNLPARRGLDSGDEWAREAKDCCGRSGATRRRNHRPSANEAIGCAWPRRGTMRGARASSIQTSSRLAVATSFALVAQAVGRAHAAASALVVLAQLAQHVQRLNVLGVVVGARAAAAQLADGAYRRAADLAHALGDGVGDRENLVGLLVEQQVIVAEVRARSCASENSWS